MDRRQVLQVSGATLATVTGARTVDRVGALQTDEFPCGDQVTQQNPITGVIDPETGWGKNEPEGRVDEDVLQLYLPPESGDSVNMQIYFETREYSYVTWENFDFNFHPHLVCLFNEDTGSPNDQRGCSILSEFSSNPNRALLPILPGNEYDFTVRVNRSSEQKNLHYQFNKNYIVSRAYWALSWSQSGNPVNPYETLNEMANTDPSPKINIHTDQPRVDEKITFDASETETHVWFTFGEEKVEYEWEINAPDGNRTYSGQTITQLFNQEGDYTVTLTVTNEFENTESVTRDFTVKKISPVSVSITSVQQTNNGAQLSITAKYENPNTMTKQTTIELAISGESMERITVNLQPEETKTETYTINVPEEMSGTETIQLVKNGKLAATELMTIQEQNTKASPTESPNETTQQESETQDTEITSTDQSASDNGSGFSVMTSVIGTVSGVGYLLSRKYRELK